MCAFLELQLNWHQASRECHSHGLQLASISSEEDDNAILAFLEKNSKMLINLVW